jgi:phospholipid transport system substrate-binding protein
VRQHGTRPAWCRRTFLAATTAAVLWRPTLASAAIQAADPEAFIKAVGDRALAALRRQASGQDERVRDLEDLLEQASDLDLVGRLALGRYWRQATKAQRAEYLKLFRDYARNGLAQRLGQYAGGVRFDVTGSRAAGGGDTMVSSEVARGEQPPVHVDWRVRKEGDRYAVVDVVAEGVSMLVTNRSQFESVVADRGIAGLLAELRTQARQGAAPRAGTI